MIAQAAQTVVYWNPFKGDFFFVSVGDLLPGVVTLRRQRGKILADDHYIECLVCPETWQNPYKSPFGGRGGLMFLCSLLSRLRRGG